METIKADQVVGEVLSSAIKELKRILDGDILFLKAPMRQPFDDAIKVEIEELKRLDKKYTKLFVILETVGGAIEVVERIVNVFRRHYKLVEFIVPNYAYSAGTVLVMSGDEIHLDYYSVLGPIDPQIELDGRYVPGMGYLAKFEDLSERINRSSDVNSVKAEMSYLINKFDPALLFLIEQSIDHSKQLLKEWLPKYKFKNWKVKETSGDKVTKRDREDRADHIATVLGDAKKWHSHGRGISMHELQSEEIKLKVNDYGRDNEMYRNVSHYHGLVVDFMAKLGYSAAIHTERGLRGLKRLT